MTEQSKRPNVVWVFGDQHRGQALSCMGDPNLNTPNIDRMAREGIQFPNAVSGFPLCCPYRGSLITSRYPHKCVPGHEYPLPEGMPTIATALNDAGYHTAYFGKWHLAGWPEGKGRAAHYITDPDRRGDFAEWTGYDNNNSQWDCWVHGGEGDDAFHYRLPGYETDSLTDMLIDYLARQATLQEESDQPFFAVLSVQPPHDPYLAPEQFMSLHNPATVEMRPNVPEIPSVQESARREIAGYYAQIENLDWNVGRIRQALMDLGLNEDTYVVFFSDHGDMHGSHGQFRKMTPHEEAIRVPFVMAGDASQYQTGHGRPDYPVNHVDIAPTTLGLCGVDVPDWMEGTDYSGLLLKGKDAGELPDSAYLQSVVPTCHGNSIDRPWRGIVTRDGWKYVCLEGQPWLMFDLNDDPYEQRNLAHNSRYWAKRKQLHDRLAQWIADTDDEFDLPEVQTRR
ncbi:MAG: sulfatase [Planctomycetota bacterium]